MLSLIYKCLLDRNLIHAGPLQLTASLVTP